MVGLTLFVKVIGLRKHCMRYTGSKPEGRAASISHTMREQSNNRLVAWFPLKSKSVEYGLLYRAQNMSYCTIHTPVFPMTYLKEPITLYASLRSVALSQHKINTSARITIAARKSISHHSLIFQWALQCYTSKSTSFNVSNKKIFLKMDVDLDNTARFEIGWSVLNT